jgi:hypothetical protein
MSDVVRRTRQLGTTTMRTLIPATPRQVELMVLAMRVVPRLPVLLQRRLWALQSTAAGALDSIALENYRATQPPPL